MFVRGCGGSLLDLGGCMIKAGARKDTPPGTLMSKRATVRHGYQSQTVTLHSGLAGGGEDRFV